MKKPFIYAFTAEVYIVFIVNFINTLTQILPQKTIVIPMAMLSLFVLSAAVMGFLFLSEPFHLYMANRQNEAVVFFGKIVSFFACFTIIIFLILLFIIPAVPAGF